MADRLVGACFDFSGNAIFSRSVGRFFLRARAVTRLSRLAVRPQGQGEQALERDWSGACHQVLIQRAYCRFAKPHLVAARWKRRCSVAHRVPPQSRRPTPQSRSQLSIELAPRSFCLCAFVGRVAWHSTGSCSRSQEHQQDDRKGHDRKASVDEQHVSDRRPAFGLPGFLSGFDNLLAAPECHGWRPSLLKSNERGLQLFPVFQAVVRFWQ